ncbi:MAG: rhomboid family intramembrane serine protease [Thermodesulfobacteriota bacterium]
MIPLRDNIPSVRRPWAVYLLVAANLGIFAFTLPLDPRQTEILLHILGVVPARFSDPAWAAASGYPGWGFLSFLTSMFLHGGWMHLGFNMWSLWIFADNVEDVMGPLRFTVFYLGCGLAALAAHYAFNLHDTQPVVGASGAIAGVMGAYFLLYPHAKVVTLIPIIVIPYIVELPAVLFLGLWFAGQVFSGLWEMGSRHGAGIAWWAHAGGFVAGMLLMPLFRRQDRCELCWRGERDWRALTRR